MNLSKASTNQSRRFNSSPGRYMPRWSTGKTLGLCLTCLGLGGSNVTIVALSMQDIICGRDASEAPAHSFTVPNSVTARAMLSLNTNSYSSPSTRMTAESIRPTEAWETLAVTLLGIGHRSPCHKLCPGPNAEWVTYVKDDPHLHNLARGIRFKLKLNQ